MKTKNNDIINLVTNLMSYGLSIIIAVVLTPFLLNHLGESAYSYIPLTNQIIGYTTVITIVITSMTSRFYSISFQEGDSNKAQLYLNTAFVASIALSCVLLIVVIISTVYVDYIMKIPQSLLNEVRLTFFLCGIVVCVDLFRSVFNVVPYSINKIYLNNIVTLVFNVSKVIIIVISFRVFEAHVWQVGLATLVASIIALFGSVIFFIRNRSGVKINLKDFKTDYLMQLVKSGAWMSVSWMGAILFLQVDLVLANRTLTPEVAGAYAVVLQMPSTLRQFSSQITNIFGPTIFKLYAKREFGALKKYIDRSVKFTMLTITLPAGYLCLMGDCVLATWVGTEYKEYGFLLGILMVLLPLNLSMNAWGHINTATNSVKVPGIVTLLMGGANFVIGYVLLKNTDLGLYALAITNTVILTIKNTLFVPVYAAYVMKEKWYEYMKQVGNSVLSMGMIIILTLLIRIAWGNTDGWLNLICIGAIVSIFYVIFVYLFFLDKEEKKIVHKLIQKYVKKASCIL